LDGGDKSILWEATDVWYCLVVLEYISGWWYTYPSEKHESVGMMKFPTEWEKKKGLKPPTSIGSCFCVDFVLHCRRFCLHWWMYYAKESDFQVELENRQEGIPRNMRYINQTKKRTSNIHATKTELDSQHAFSTRVSHVFPMIFPEKNGPPSPASGVSLSPLAQTSTKRMGLHSLNYSGWRFQPL
jgi:hypothetical protein